MERKEKVTEQHVEEEEEEEEKEQENVHPKTFSLSKLPYTDSHTYTH